MQCNPQQEYFISKYLSKKKSDNRPSSEIFQELKQFNIYEYGTNQNPEVYDPANYIKNENEYYEELVKASMQKKNNKN